MFYWSESFTSLVRFWQPQFDGLTRLTLTPLDFTTDLRHWYYQYINDVPVSAPLKSIM